MIDLLFGYALFASAISLNKSILVWLSPAFFVGIRRLSSGLILLIYHAFYSHRFRLTYIKPDFLVILAISIMTMFLPSVLKAYGFKYLVSSKAALIGSLDPFVTALYAYFLWSERLSKNKFFGMCIAFAGILFLMSSTAPAEELLGGWKIFSLPELAVFASMVISRYGWIKARTMLHTERYTPSELNCLNMILSGLLALGMAYACATCNFCAIPQTLEFAFLFGYAVLIGDVLCYNLYGMWLKKYSMTFLSLCGLTIPLFVHLLGPVLHGEPITLHFFISLAFVSLGTFIFYRDELASR